MTPRAEQVVRRLSAAKATLAAAESLTGGLVTAAIASVPGASAVLRGGVTAYATDLKASLLGVDPQLLGERGPVDAEVARQMAAGVARRLASTYAVSTTGVAGPEPQDGHPVGEVWVAAWGPGGDAVHGLHLTGDRAQVRAGATDAALDLLLRRLDAEQVP